MLQNDTIFKQKIQINDQVLTGIISSYKMFYTKFLGINNNFKHAQIFENEHLTSSVRSKNFLTNDDIVRVPVRNHMSVNMIKNLTISKITTDGRMLNKTEFENYIGAEVDRVFFAKLTSIYNTAHTRYEQGNANLGLNINQSFRTWKKGSRRFRNVLSSGKTDYVPHNIVKFASNTDTVINLECS
jgi:hypothetical protein